MTNQEGLLRENWWSKKRLAVELDGDKYHGPEEWLNDYFRQQQLERVGWQFWRCFASA